jgi:hypothetical protein
VRSLTVDIRSACPTGVNSAGCLGFLEEENYGAHFMSNLSQQRPSPIEAKRNHRVKDLELDISASIPMHGLRLSVPWAGLADEFDRI